MIYSTFLIISIICCPLTLIAARGRVFNGATAPKELFLYHVRVRVPINATLNSNGGGSLLNTAWVLTAAHCFDKGNKNLTEVRLGQDGEYIIRWAENVIIHENYIKVTPKMGPINDIALIKIPEIPVDVLKSAGLKTVDLPSPLLQKQQQNRKRGFSIEEGQFVVITGWGRIDNVLRPATALQFTTLKILSDNDCLTYVKGAQVASQFCAFASNSSACPGDSGGPAVLQGSNTQMGIMSYMMDGKCRAGFPVVCTRVSYYTSWIKNQMALN